MKTKLAQVYSIWCAARTPVFAGCSVIQNLHVTVHHSTLGKLWNIIVSSYSLNTKEAVVKMATSVNTVYIL